MDALRYLRAGDAERGAGKLSECTRIASLSGAPLDSTALMAGR